MPTLRQRLSESPAELDQLVRLMAARITGAEAPDLVADAMEALNSGLPRDYAWPGNVRELEQAVRRILLTGRYAPRLANVPMDESEVLLDRMRGGELTSTELLAQYCAMLHRKFGTYAKVAELTGIDPRTARKYVEGAQSR